MIYLVQYGDCRARFQNYGDAIRFARLSSRLGSPWQCGAGCWSEARRTRGKGAGIIAQFSNGTPTPEFAFLGNAKGQP